jgi:hypothetical protein
VVGYGPAAGRPLLPSRDHRGHVPVQSTHHTQPAVEAGVVVLSTVAPRSPAGLSWSDLR